MKKNLRLSTLSYLGFELNAALEAGHLKTVSFGEVYAGLDSGTLIADLEAKLGGAIDLSLLKNSDQTPLLLGVLNEAKEALEGRERRKVGVSDSGICLVIALILEAIQQYNWDTAQTR